MSSSPSTLSHSKTPPATDGYNLDDDNVFIVGGQIIDGYTKADLTDENRAHSSEVLRKLWGDRPYIAAGGMDGATAINTVEKYGGLVAFGRDFIANVSLVFGSQWSHFSDHIAARSSFAPEGRSLFDAL